MNTFQHDSETLTLDTSRHYDNGNLAVVAETASGEPYATLSVNMPGEPLPDGVFFVKYWSENAGVARSFIGSGLIEPVKTIPPRQSGYVLARAYRFVGA